MSAALDDLKRDPEYTEVELLGESRPFLITVYGAKRARQDIGIDFVRRLVDVMGKLAQHSIDEQAGKDDDEFDPSADEVVEMFSDLDITTKDLEAFGAILYAGLVTFDEDVDPDNVLRGLTIGRLRTLIPEIGPKIFSFLQDADEEATEIEHAEHAPNEDEVPDDPT